MYVNTLTALKPFRDEVVLHMQQTTTSTTYLYLVMFAHKSIHRGRGVTERYFSISQYADLPCCTSVLQSYDRP